MTPTQRKAMEMARKVLDYAAEVADRPGLMKTCEDAANALRAALAEPDEYTVEVNGKRSAVLTAMMNSRKKAEPVSEEPVAWYYERDGESAISFKPDRDPDKSWQPLYTHPPGRSEASISCESTNPRSGQKREPTNEKPYCYIYEYDMVYGLHREFYPGPYNGKQTPDRAVPVYTHPPKREPLTEKEILRLYREAWTPDTEANEILDFARAIERAHGIGGEKK